MGKKNNEVFQGYLPPQRVTQEEVNVEKANEGREKVSGLRTALCALAIILGIGASYHLADALDLGTRIKNLFNNEKELDDEMNSVVMGDSQLVPTPAPTAAPIIGSFVDNNNQVLYISGLEDIKEVDKGNVINDGTKKTYSSSSISTSNTNPSSTYVNNGYINNGVQNNTYINNSGDMDINASQDNTVSPVGPESTIIYPTAAPTQTPAPTQAPVATPVPTTAPTEAPTQTPGVEEVKYEGYVLRKLNYSADGRWYSFYFANDEIVVHSDDLEMMDESLLSPYNSNILGISDTNSRPGWVYVRDLTAADFISLDSCDNLDAAINAQLDEQNRALGLK